MPRKFSNNASSMLAAGISAVAASLTVQAGHGARFPVLAGSDYFTITVQEGAVWEIMRVTARATDVFTILRGQEGSTAQTFTTAASVELRVSADALNDFVSRGGDTLAGTLQAPALVTPDLEATVADVGALEVDSLNGGPLRGRTNLLLNSTFGVNQRNAGTVTTSGDYPSDNFRMVFNGGSMSAQAFALSDSDRSAIGSDRAEVGMRLTVVGGGGAGDYATLQTAVRSVRSLAGKPAAFAVWARRISGSGNLGVELVQKFGTGGSPSADVAGIGTTALAVTGAWQRLGIVNNVPSVTGKTLGSNGDHALHLLLWGSAGSSFTGRAGVGIQTATFEVTMLQLEEGPVATPYEWRETALEELACRQFYEAMNVVLYKAGGGGSFGGAHLTVSYKVRKAKTPTLQYWSGTSRTGTQGVLFTNNGNSAAFGTLVTRNDAQIWNGGALPNPDDYASGTLEFLADYV